MTDIRHQNQKIIAKCLNAKSTNKFIKWYMYAFERSHNFYQLKHIQSGGESIIATTNVNGTNYDMKLNILEQTDEYDNSRGTLHLLSPTRGDSTYSCVTVLFPISNKGAYIRDLNTYSNCTNMTNAPRNAGKMYIDVVLAYLVANKEKLGIEYAYLEDKAYFNCKCIIGKCEINLEKSHQMVGKLPYYTRFGFKPYLKSSRDILRNNRKIMKTILTKDLDFVKSFPLQKIPDAIIKYTLDHPDQLMSKTLQEISTIDCTTYFRIYESLFDYFGLISLEWQNKTNQSLYVLKL